MSSQRPKDKAQPEKAGAKPKRTGFSFAESEDSGLREKTWFRRAIDAGLKYKEELSERSGLRVVPEISLSESDVNQPAALSLPPQPHAQWGASLETFDENRPGAGGGFRPALAAVDSDPELPPDDEPEPPPPPRQQQQPQVAVASPAQLEAASNVFAPSHDALIGGTAINEFVKMDEQVQRRNSSRQMHVIGNHRGRVAFYTPPPKPRRTLLKVTLALIIIGCAGFISFRMLKQSRWGIMVDHLKAKITAPKKAAEPADAPAEAP